MTLIIVLAFIGILGALAAAGVLMLKRRKGQSSMARALALRVALSVALFLFILLSAKMGWIQPTGVPIGR